MTPSEVLEAVRSLLLAEGWTQNHYFNDDGYCLVGAVNHVVPVDDEFGQNWEYAAIPAMRAIKQLIDENPDPLHSAGDGHGTCLHLWNDDPRRSLNDLLGVIERALQHAPACTGV